MRWTLRSPGELTEITVEQKETGELFYQVLKKGHMLIQESALGLSTDYGDFTEGLVFQKEERNSIREEYSIPVGKKEIYDNHAEELTLSLSGRKSILRLDSGPLTRRQLFAMRSLVRAVMRFR